VKAFFKQRALLLGMLAVAVPLTLILYWQYTQLRTLERTLPIYRKQVMLDYLRAVTWDIESYYRGAAERVLSLPATAITNRKGGIIANNRDGTAVLDATRQVAEHFSREQFEGATRLFLVVDTEVDGWDKPVVLFFNPERNALEPDPSAKDELRAINVACAPYLIYIRAGTKLDPRPMGIDRDPMHPLLVKPVREDDERIIAVAGMIISHKHFDDNVLPNAIQQHLKTTFPEDYQEVMVGVSDETGEPIWGKEPLPTKKADAYTRFGLVFQRWFLTTRMRNETEEQWARRNFNINLVIWAGLALLLVGGVAVTLRSASRAVKLSEMKSDFVSNVSHELRTPLASIRVFGEFFKLGRVADQQKVREYGEYIETESRRLTGLINNILDFSKIESGQKAYKFESADLSEIVADTLRTFDVRLKQSDFEIKVETPRSPLPLVRIDSDAITQALVNLLDNAVKYSGDARVITVRVAQVDKWVTVSVIDRGIGISTDDQEKIFERFHRVSTGLVHEVRGNGLGLAIVKHIIDAHHGKVTVESRPGRGSTFTIQLLAEEGPVSGRAPSNEPAIRQA
jgi:signal transduction histidine kinase